MTELFFEMKTFDLENVRSVIGPFHLDDDIELRFYLNIKDELEHGVHGVGEYRVERRNHEDYIIIDGRISYELEGIIKGILGQDENDK